MKKSINASHTYITTTNATTATGTVTRDRDNVVRFGLSAEEMGLLLHQLPLDQTVELVRKPTSNAAGESMYENSITTTLTAVPHKICTITPQPADATVEWKVDFELDGVGGQVMSNGMPGPLVVTMQAGEVQVVLEIMRTSLPLLVGWTSLQQIAVQKAVNDATTGRGGGGGPQQDPFGF